MSYRYIGNKTRLLPVLMDSFREAVNDGAYATVARWDGDKERDREFHRYVDADIYESLKRYFRHQLEQARAKALDEAAARNLMSSDDARNKAFDAMWYVATEKLSLEATNDGGARYSITGGEINELWYAAIRAIADQEQDDC